MGIIMYTPDGYMSAQLSQPNRKPFASGAWFKGTDDDYKQEASTYIAHTDEFHVDLLPKIENSCGRRRVIGGFCELKILRVALVFHR
jgi:hypothetical protein